MSTARWLPPLTVALEHGAWKLHRSAWQAVSSRMGARAEPAPVHGAHRGHAAAALHRGARGQRGLPRGRARRRGALCAAPSLLGPHGRAAWLEGSWRLCWSLSRGEAHDHQFRSTRCIPSRAFGSAVAPLSLSAAARAAAWRPGQAPAARRAAGRPALPRAGALTRGVWRPTLP